MEKPCSVACADAGYLDTDDMEKVSKQNIEVIIAAKSKRSTKGDLTYDGHNDCFISSARQTIIASWINYRPKKHELFHRAHSRLSIVPAMHKIKNRQSDQPVIKGRRTVKVYRSIPITAR